MAKKKSHIFQLEDGDMIIKGEDPLKSYITDYYKKIFGPFDSGMFSFDEDNRDNITKIALEDNEKLVDVFIEQEVKEAVFKMKHNKALGPVGFLAKFYQIV
jgi:hypothetical protein